MILLLCWIISNLAPFLQALAESIVVIIITLAGLVILLRTVGLKIHNKLGSTILSGIFKILEKLISNPYNIKITGGFDYEKRQKYFMPDWKKFWKASSLWNFH